MKLVVQNSCCLVEPLPGFIKYIFVEGGTRAAKMTRISISSATIMTELSGRDNSSAVVTMSTSASSGACLVSIPSLNQIVHETSVV